MRKKRNFYRSGLIYFIQNINRETRLLLLISICLISGVLLGSFLSYKLDSALQYDIIKSFDDMMTSYQSDNLVKNHIFINSAIKHCLMVALLWALPVFSSSSIPVFLLIAFKGTGLGFTTSLLIGEYGTLGFGYALCAYFPQNIIVSFTYFIISCYSLNIILYSKKRSLKDNIRFTPLLIGLSLCLLTAFFEAYITPIIINIF